MFCTIHRLYIILVIAPSPTYIYTLSLHDAFRSSTVKSTLYAAPGPSRTLLRTVARSRTGTANETSPGRSGGRPAPRSEEHTSELQSHSDLVCRLLLEKKKKINTTFIMEYIKYNE